MRNNGESENFSLSGPNLDQISDWNIFCIFRGSVSTMFWLIMVLVEVAILRRGRHALECRRRMIPAGMVRPDKESPRIFRQASDRDCCRSRNYTK